MKLYYFNYPEHENEYEKVDETEDNVAGLEPKANATKEAIQSLYRFNVECEDKTNKIVYNAKELSNKMIDKFKASKCYLQKTEAERKAIIQYLKDNPEVVENNLIDY